MAEPTDDLVIRFTEVHKSFGERRILKGIDLQVRRGETTVLLGPSGTGKSVMLKLVVGLLQPTSGTVEVFGEDLSRLKKTRLYSLRRRIGMMFQDGALFDSMTVGQNVAFPLERHTRRSASDIREEVSRRLDQVGLPGTEGLFPSELSGGMRKRVSLARAVVLEPEIILFDEPNSGLDPITSDGVDQLIVDMKKELGITFVVISHDIVGAFRVADRLAMLQGGKIIARGTPTEVRNSQDPRVRSFLQRNLELPELIAPIGGPE